MIFPACLLGLVASAAAAGCPYADLHKRGQDSHGHRGNQHDVQPDFHNAPSRPRPSHTSPSASPSPSAGTNGIFYMNRIGPSGSQLYIANADGSDEQLLLGNQTDPYDYHASWSPDGNWIVFTSERRSDGQADLYRVQPDGTQLETLVSSDSIDDVGVLSPDGLRLAFMSTQGNYTSNIWVLELDTGHSYNVTETPSTRPVSEVSPRGHYRPSWSPDGEWIAFSSDRETDWTGHSDGTGWEHTQTLSLYIVRPNGTDLRRIVGQDGMAYGSPQWSPDGTKLICNVITSEDTYASHGVDTQQEAITGQIYSIDIATGVNETLTSGDYLKVGQHYIGSDASNIAYVVKGGPLEGIYYTTPDDTHVNFNRTGLRNPSWSPDGSRVVYEILEWDVRAGGKPLFSFDADWDYRFMDVFPQYNNATGRLAITQKQLGNSSVVTSTANYTDLDDVFDVYDIWSLENETEVVYIASGLGGAFQPTWSPEGDQIIVGMGTWFFDRSINPATLWLANATVGSTRGDYVNLTATGGSLNAGFPSWSPDGTRVVYRLWDWIASVPLGLRVLDLTTGETTVLTTGWDNTPGWSPDGERIVFTRQTNWTAEYGSRWYSDRFDVMTIRPDGSELTQVTDSLANDAHAVWAYDGRILWSSGMYGFRDESALYDNTFQPYGQIMVMDYDGSNKQMLTDTLWEDSMPIFIPA